MNPSTVLVMALTALIGFFGLFIASRAVDTGMDIFGLVLFAFGILMNFWLLKRHFDKEEAGSHR